MKNLAHVGVLTGLAALSSVTTQVRADDEPFNLGSSMAVGNDFNSGSANFWADGMNAVPTRISSNITSGLNRNGDMEIYVSMRVEGVFGDPTAHNPYYDFLENYGLHTDGSHLLTEVLLNGDTWEYDYPVEVSFSGQARIFRFTDDAGDIWMTGYFANNVSAQGAVPVDTYISYNRYLEPTPPYINYQFSVDFGVRLIVTEEYRLVPTPGSGALAGLGTMFFARRRRR